MNNLSEVLNMIYPEGGWVIRGNTFDDIEFIEANPITKEELNSAIAEFENWKINQQSIKEAEKNALLAKLGLTAEEVAALLS